MKGPRSSISRVIDEGQSQHRERSVVADVLGCLRVEEVPVGTQEELRKAREVGDERVAPDEQVVVVDELAREAAREGEEGDGGDDPRCSPPRGLGVGCDHQLCEL